MEKKINVATSLTWASLEHIKDSAERDGRSVSGWLRKAATDMLLIESAGIRDRVVREAIEAYSRTEDAQ